jgi:uncharacterized membrane protein
VAKVVLGVSLMSNRLRHIVLSVFRLLITITIVQSCNDAQHFSLLLSSLDGAKMTS